MKQKSTLLLPAIIIFIIFGVMVYFNYQKNESSPTTTVTTTCEKENNCCNENNDCEYYGYTGGCQTSEYINKINEENSKNGLIQGGVPLFVGEVNCTCESKTCFAKDINGCQIFANKSTWCAVKGKCLSSLKEECR